MRGISLHVGINAYPSRYANATLLHACRNDAKAMYNIARKLGYSSVDNAGFLPDVWDGTEPKPASVLIGAQAKVEPVRKYFHDAAGILKEGDAFMFTFSGHGGQMPNTNGDDLETDTVSENDGQDEVFCLFDNPILDDILHGWLEEFADKVRIYVVLDCCNSGSGPGGFLLDARVHKPLLTQWLTGVQQTNRLNRFWKRFIGGAAGDKDEPAGGAAIGAIKSMRSGDLMDLIAKTPKEAPIVKLWNTYTDRDRGVIKAFVAKYAACAQNQITRDRDDGTNGLFTGKVIEQFKPIGAQTCIQFADVLKAAAPLVVGSDPQFEPSDPRPGLQEFLDSPVFVI